MARPCPYNGMPWPRSGQLMTISWPLHGHVMAIKMPSLIARWPFRGRGMAIAWSCNDHFMGLAWPFYRFEYVGRLVAIYLP
eukprot:9681082-Lingulodinium_polyedra.AAC.1